MMHRWHYRCIIDNAIDNVVDGIVDNNVDNNVNNNIDNIVHDNAITVTLLPPKSATSAATVQPRPTAIGRRL